MADTSALAVAAIVVTAAASLAGTVYTSRTTRKVSDKQGDIEDKKVEADAYELAQSINQQTLDRLQAEIVRIQAVRTSEQAEAIAQITSLEGQVRSLREMLHAERGVSDDLRRKVRMLERDVAKLKRTLMDNQLDVPELSGGSP